MTHRTIPLTIRDERDRERVLGLIGALNIAKPWTVTVAPYRKARTLSQNALMWKWINEVADHVREHTGMDSDDVHEFFKAKFLPARVVELSGEAIEYRTTTKLTTTEMHDYMERIYAFCTSELGMYLPVPEDLGRDAA